MPPTRVCPFIHYPLEGMPEPLTFSRPRTFRSALAMGPGTPTLWAVVFCRALGGDVPPLCRGLHTLLYLPYAYGWVGDGGLDDI